MKFDFYNKIRQHIRDAEEIIKEEDDIFLSKINGYVEKIVNTEYVYPAIFLNSIKSRLLDIQQENLPFLLKAEGCFYYAFSCLLQEAEKLGFTAHQFDLAFFLLHGNDQQMFINLCNSTGEDAYNISTSAISVFVSVYNWLSASYKSTIASGGSFVSLNTVIDAAIQAVSNKPNITMKGQKTPPKTVGGCYVATAVYGSYDCPQVWVLRRYRDNYLGTSWFGRAFIKFYYAVSPTMVKWFGKTKWFNKFFKRVLDKKIIKLKNKGYLDTEYQDIDWSKKK